MNLVLIMQCSQHQCWILLDLHFQRSCVVLQVLKQGLRRKVRIIMFTWLLLEQSKNSGFNNSMGRGQYRNQGGFGGNSTYGKKNQSFTSQRRGFCPAAQNRSHFSSAPIAQNSEMGIVTLSSQPDLSQKHFQEISFVRYVKFVLRWGILQLDAITDSMRIFRLLISKVLYRCLCSLIIILDHML